MGHQAEAFPGTFRPKRSQVLETNQRSCFQIGKGAGMKRLENLNQVENFKLAIEEEVIRRKCQRVEVEKEAHAILDKMGHKYSIWNVKGFGYVVTKVLRV